MRAVVVGAGHNGLVCACYLARAGVDVLVLEAAGRPGGGSRTEETVPGHAFDLHSVAHNIVNMTGIPEELDLAGAGLEYLEMDPFAVAVFADGRRVRFHRDVGATMGSIAETDPAEAERYGELMAAALPLVDLGTAGLAGRPRALLRHAPRGLRAAARLGGDLLSGYGRLLDSRFASDLVRGPVAAFAAHASAQPDMAGGALFGIWQAAYHRHGQWHARGGAQGLTDALVRRLEASGGTVRAGAPVARIDAGGGTARAVVLEDGERIPADVVVTAVEPRTALLELLDPPLHGTLARRLRAVTRANGVQAVVHVATTALPPYPDARPGDWNGLQSYVDELDGLRRGFRAAEDGRLASPAPAYAFTTSALDPTLAPPGHHTVYLATPSAPFAVRDGWAAAGPRLADDLVAQVEARAPGFRDSIVGLSVRTPEHMAAELRWPGAHPFHVDITPDQLGPLRPLPELAGHRTPVPGLYLTGAGTAPVGGIAGAPGRAAARAVLKDARRAGARRSRSASPPR